MIQELLAIQHDRAKWFGAIGLGKYPQVILWRLSGVPALYDTLPTHESDDAIAAQGLRVWRSLGQQFVAL